MTKNPIMIPMTDQYKEFAKKHTGFLEKAYISKPIEYEGVTYRLLVIYPRIFAKDYFNKFLVITDKLTIINNKDIRLYCLKVYLTYEHIFINSDLFHPYEIKQYEELLIKFSGLQQAVEKAKGNRNDIFEFKSFLEKNLEVLRRLNVLKKEVKPFFNEVLKEVVVTEKAYKKLNEMLLKWVELTRELTIVALHSGDSRTEIFNIINSNITIDPQTKDLFMEVNRNASEVVLTIFNKIGNGDETLNELISKVRALPDDEVEKEALRVI